MSHRSNTLRRLLVGAGVITVCVIVAVVTTWELAAKLSTHLDRSTQDTMVHMWNCWWIRQAIVRGVNPYWCDALFYPGGVSLVTHNITWFNALFSYLIAPALGYIAAYNLSILVSIVLCGLAAFWLAYRLTGSVGAALVAAVIYEAWPFRISHLGHPNILATQWIPLFLLALIHLADTGRWRDSVLAGLWFALVGYTRWQLMIAAALMGSIYTAFWLAQARARWRLVARLAVAALVAGALLAPAVGLFAPYAADPTGTETLLHLADAERTQADLLSFFVPWYRHPVYGDYLTTTYERLYATASRPMYPTYLGWLTLLLAVIGYRSRSREARPWLVMALVLVLLALGPVLRLNGTLYPQVPTLSRLLAPLKVFDLMRFPHRYVMFLALPCCVLAAYGVAALLRRLPPRAAWLRAGLALLLCAVVVFDYLGAPVSLRSVADELSPGLTQLAGEEGQFAVFNLPMGYQWVKQYMLEQTVHGRPIIQGHISRIPDTLDDVFSQHPEAALVEPNAERQPPPADLLPRLALLHREGVRYIILHAKLLAPEDLSAWRAAMPDAPVYEDDLLVIYATAQRQAD